MKKTQLLAAFIFAAVALKAQTKEETLQWIKDKLGSKSMIKNSNCDGSGSARVEGGHLTNAYDSIYVNSAGWMSGYKDYWSIDQAGALADLSNVTIDNKNICGANNYPFIHLVFKSTSSVRTNLTGNIIGYDKYCNCIDLFLKWDMEDDLLNRMVKAFKHLVELQKAKEAF